MDYLFSVIVPIYKTEEYLEQCIDSILGQKYTSYEVILVDDGSPDKCPIICDQYIMKFNNIRVIHKTNGGLVSARKAGCLEAKGRYIVFVDSDDLIEENYLGKFADGILKSNADIIVADGYTHFTEKNEYPVKVMDLNQRYYTGEKYKTLLKESFLSNGEYGGFTISPSLCLKCIRREILQEAIAAVPEEINMGEDVAISLASAVKAESLYCIESTEYKYRINDTVSMTRTYKKDLDQKLLNLIHFLRTLFEENELNMDQLLCYCTLLNNILIDNELYYSEGNYSYSSKIVKRYVKDQIVRMSLDYSFSSKPPMKIRINNMLLRNNMLYVIWIRNKIVKTLK